MTSIRRNAHGTGATPPPHTKRRVVACLALFGVSSGCGRKDPPLIEVRNDDVTEPFVLHVSFGGPGRVTYPTLVQVSPSP
jgi:hypothetical protein